MTVSNIYTPPQYAANGVTTAFAFSYSFFSLSDLIVTLFNTSTNAVVSPAPVLNGGAAYDYIVTGTQDVNTGEYSGGATITFNTAPAGGLTITIRRSVSDTQNVALLENGPFPSKTVEGALDRRTMVEQELAAGLARAIQAPWTDPALNMTLPPAAQRANQLVGFDGAGDLIMAQPANAPVSVAMQPVVDAASPAAALALLGGLTVAALQTGAVPVLATATALQAATTDTLTGPTVFIEGRSSPGDDGDGIFRLGPATTADGGTIYNDASGRSWYRLGMGGAASVKWFGAKGDGVTDDTAAINAALWTGSIVFPAGTYGIRSDLVPRVPNTTISSTQGATLLALTTAAFTSAMITILVSGITVSGLIVDGNYNAGSLYLQTYMGVTTAGGVTAGPTGTTLRDLTITRVPFDAINIQCANGTYVTRDITIDNVTIIDVGWAGIYLTGAKGVQVSNCRVLSSGYAGLQTDYFSKASGGVTACSGVQVTNFYVDRASPPSHVLTGQVESGFLFGIGAGTVNLTLSGSVLLNNNRLAVAWDGIGLGQDDTNLNEGITITGNIVSNTAGYGIDISNGMTCSDNNITNAVAAGIKIGLDVGTQLHDAVIANNQIINVVPVGGNAYGIFSSSATGGSGMTNILIQGNSVVDNRGGVLTTHPLFIEFNNITYKNVQISDNDFGTYSVAAVGTDMATPVPSHIFCRDNVGLEWFDATSGTTLDATFYEGIILNYGSGTTLTNIYNGWDTHPVVLFAANGNATLSTGGSGGGTLSFSGASTKTLSAGQSALAIPLFNGQKGIVFT